MSPLNPYELLGISPLATSDEVRTAYRRRAAQVHPDLQPASKKEWAAEQMRQLNAARDQALAGLAAPPRPAYAPPGAEAEFDDYAAWYANLVQRRRRAEAARRQLVMTSLFVVLGLMCALAVFAPGLLVMLVQVLAGVMALVLSAFVPLLVAGLLGYFLFSLRNH